MVVNAEMQSFLRKEFADFVIGVCSLLDLVEG